MIPCVSKTRTFARNYRSLLALGVSALLAELGYAILNLSALPMYVKFNLNRGAEWGIILSTFLLAEALIRPPAGMLGDRIGRKALMLAGPAITAVTAYLTIKCHGPYVLLGLMALRAIDGLGSGALWTSAFAAVGDIVGEKNRTAAMSVLNVTYMGGLALGFVAGGAANEIFGTLTASFYLVSVLLVLSFLTMLIFIPSNLGKGKHAEPIHGEPLELPILEEPSEFKFAHVWRSFREVPDMVVLALVTFFGMGLLTPIVKLYAVEHLGMTETQFGLLVAPVAGAMGIFAVPLGRMGDKYGKCRAVAWGILGSAVAMWIVALFRSVILAGVGAVVIGLGFTVAFPAWNALVISITSSERRGEVLGAVGLVQGLAAIVGASLGAFVYSSDILSFPRLGVVNYNVPFWISAILLSVAAVITFTWVCGRRCYVDPAHSVTDLQRKWVVIAAITGFMVMIAWIGFRYTTPVSPDRVAWEWVQQAVRGRPHLAMKYATQEFEDGCRGEEQTARVSRIYNRWRTKDQARYTVLNIASQSDGHAMVPVKFVFPDKRVVIQDISLIKGRRGEWKVCSVHSRNSNN
ncbi:MAG: MFS transporter [Armatimonadota bacterium]|nr:MFS transporter [bacterium]